ncbi:mechanosensitive ion channel protein MscS, partial [Erwinia amylovora]|uniref:mechanosensitive ion channel family protein n=1 Tax=Erwinia amylovora TaxID=552 RepID=UPI0038601B89|nr:mechanosensitive ion channel protein MscS [Erwinia amylovora]
MDNLNVVDGINNAGGWLVRNQALLLVYVVNIVAAIVIVIVGMMAARFIAKT